MNAQTKIKTILSTVFSNVEVGSKVKSVWKNKDGYSVNTAEGSFQVKSVKHAQEIVEEEIDMQADKRWHAYVMSAEYVSDFNNGTVKSRSSFYS